MKAPLCRRCQFAAALAIGILVWAATGHALRARRCGEEAGRARALADEAIQRSEQSLAAFPRTSDPADLERGIDSVERVLHTTAGTPRAEELRLRRVALELVLRLYAMADASLDPSADPRCPAVMRVRSSGSRDPAEVAAFAKSLAELDARDARAVRDDRLRRVQRRAADYLDAHIELEYRATPEDRTELAETLQRLLPGPRAARFAPLIPR